MRFRWVCIRRRACWIYFHKKSFNSEYGPSFWWCSTGPECLQSKILETREIQSTFHFGSNRCFFIIVNFIHNEMAIPRPSGKSNSEGGKVTNSLKALKLIPSKGLCLITLNEYSLRYSCGAY